MFVSYAQNFEDVLLWRAFKNVSAGFYIDIGAQDPNVDSVSRAFYERGWRGVHVEPIARYAEMLRAARPDEEVIEAAIATQEGTILFFDVPDTGLSTGEAANAEKHGRSGFQIRPIQVAAIRLSSLLDRYEGRDIHWLKIDVEGMEHDVLESWAPSAARPWVVVIESTLPSSPEPSFSEWEPLLLELDYEFAHFDGLNRYYVHAAHSELRSVLELGPNIFDGFSIGSETPYAQKLNSDIADLKHNFEALPGELTLENRELAARLARREEDLAALQAKLDASDIVNAERLAEIGRLKLQESAISATHRREIAVLQKTLAVHSERIEALQTALRAREATLAEHQAEISRLNLREAALSEGHLRQMSALEADAAIQLDQVRSLQIDLAAHDVTIAEYLAEIERLKLRETAVLETHVQETSAMQAALIVHLGKIDSLQTALEANDAAVAAGIAEINRLNQSTAEMEADYFRQLDELHSKLTSGDRAIADHLTEIEQLQQQLAAATAVNQQVVALKVELTAREQSFNEHQLALEERDDKIAKLDAAMATASSHAAEAERAVVAMQHSTSWRITAPLRGVKKAGLLVLRCSRWFIRGLCAWITLKPGSRPRRVARGGLVRSAHFILRRPQLAGAVKRAFRMLPEALQSRLRSIVMTGASAPSTVMVRSLVGEDVSELSARAKEIYMLMLAERSARRGD